LVGDGKRRIFAGKIRIMRKIVLLLLGAALLLGCQQGKISQQLSEVNELLVAELNDSAYQKINEIDESAISNPADKAYYTLLKVRSALLVGKPVVSADSLLDGVIAYYEQNPDKEKLTDAYYYRAIVSSNQKDYKQAILLYKKAEELAVQSKNMYQQYKIAEGIAFVNRMSKKYDLQLKYAKKAYSLAKALDKKNWVAYSCYTIQYAYLYLGYKDSAYIFLQEIPLYIRYAKKSELPVLLTTLGYYLRDDHPEEAKQYLREALSYHELTSTYAYLAEVCYHEGKPEEAYQYWKKALVLKDSYPKDNIIRNLIEFDLERGRTDSISDMVTQIIEIRDSIDAKLRNDTIKDLQTRFDHETALREKDQTIIKWQWGILILAVALLISVGLYLRRQYLAKIQLQAYQMQIHEYLNQIAELKASGTDAQQEIEELNKNIRDIMDNRSPSLSKGRMLYDDVVENKGKDKWKKDDIEAFLEYYTATNYKTVERIRKTPREEPLTDYRLLFLILVEMGKSDYEIMQILSITKETLRTHRYRTRAQE
jgi:tetratricopeptide (TPR) repeat protein